MTATGFGIISIFGIEEQKILKRLQLISFGIISIFGIEEHIEVFFFIIICFGIISIFGIEELSFNVSGCK